MNIRVPSSLLKALEPYDGTARLVGPEMAFDSAPIQKGGPGRRLVGWTLVVALATTPASVATVQEIGRTIQIAIEHDGISTVRIEVDGINVQADRAASRDEGGSGAGGCLCRAGEGPEVTRPAALAATAHHEAGHAVAAIPRGIPFDYVTITAEEDASGHIRYLRGARGLQQVHNRSIAAMAGEAAQRRFSPRSVRRHHGAGDREAVVAYALPHVGSVAAATALVRLWDVQARGLVEVQWPRIERLAAALLDKRRLSEAECKALLMQPVRSALT